MNLALRPQSEQTENLNQIPSHIAIKANEQIQGIINLTSNKVIMAKGQVNSHHSKLFSCFAAAERKAKRNRFFYDLERTADRWLCYISIPDIAI
jgi:hypothetical protein